MTPIEQVLLAGQAFVRSLRVAGRGAPWLPWLALFAVQALLVFGFAWGAHPALAWAAVPIAHALGRGDVFRYPSLFEQLPGLVARLDGLASIVLVPLASGLTTALFAARFTGRPLPLAAAWRETLGRAGALVLASLPATVGIGLLHASSDALLATRLSSLTRRVVPDAAAIATLLIEAACAYVAALVVLERRGALSALIALPGTWVKGFLAALTFTLLGALVVAPFILLVRQAPVVVDRGVPELVMVLLLLRYAAGAIAALAACGAATLVFLSEVHAVEERA